MTDHHVHVGWYRDGYHSPQEVWQAEKAAGVDNIVVSSTSTCAELYKLVVREMRELVRLGGQHVHPLLWLTPRMMRTWGLRYMLHSKIRWQGVKMHWQAHREWYYNKRLTAQALQLVEQLNVPLLLHTSEFKECEAAVFEPLISAHPEVTFVLAHGKPLKQTIYMLQHNKNVYVDTAFMPAENVARLIDAGFAHRILFGTDAPINLIYYYNVSTAEYLRSTIKELQSVIGTEMFNEIANQNIYK